MKSHQQRVKSPSSIENPVLLWSLTYYKIWGIKEAEEMLESTAAWDHMNLHHGQEETMEL